MRPLQKKDGKDILPDAKQQTEFGRQLELLVNQLKSFPSIATWVGTSVILEIILIY